MSTCIPWPLKDTMVCVYWSGKMLVTLSDLNMRFPNSTYRNDFSFLNMYSFIRARIGRHRFTWGNVEKYIHQMLTVVTLADGGIL